MGSNVLVRPNNAVYLAWQALNPSLPWPATELGELAELGVPEDPSAKYQAGKQRRAYRKRGADPQRSRLRAA